ncbi:uncharacterized protein LOC111073743 [Drosophila obscura]|uniref:uncharacterized protein LOC111073743 n=1 Tax=Drosophila obscura TaxID=7282 RepID=UPI000B9FCF7B|nr:uncharacterized protein LOC111073743 [Drosophila obscura]
MQRRQQENFYQVLNVPVNSSDQEIKSRFFELSKRYHPDANSQSGDSERFAKLCEAYNTLHRPSMRKQYDTSMKIQLQKYAQLDRVQQNVGSVWQQFHTQMRNKQKRCFYNGIAGRMPTTALASLLPVKTAVLDPSQGCRIVNREAPPRFKWNLCRTGFSLFSGLLILSFLMVRHDNPWSLQPPILYEASSKRDEPPSSLMSNTLDLLWAGF